MMKQEHPILFHFCLSDAAMQFYWILSFLTDGKEERRGCVKGVWKTRELIRKSWCPSKKASGRRSHNNNGYYLYRDLTATTMSLNAFSRALSNLILTTVLWDLYFHYLHLTGEGNLSLQTLVYITCLTLRDLCFWPLFLGQLHVLYIEKLFWNQVSRVPVYVLVQRPWWDSLIKCT